MAQGPRDDQPRRNDGAFHRFVKAPKAPIVHSTKDNLQVLYEDNHIVAVNKRSGDVVQGSGTGEASLCEVVAQYIAQKYNKPGKAYIGTVHRLDRPVSGVILYARTSKAHKRLSTMFRHREMQKTYWAVVKPAPPQTQGHVINYLAKNEKINKKYGDRANYDPKESAKLLKKAGNKNINPVKMRPAPRLRKYRPPHTIKKIAMNRAE